MLFFFTFYSSNNQIKMCQTNIKQHNSFNTDNKSVYYNDSWRSCDTEEWSNDAKNYLLRHRNKWYFKVC